MVDFSGWYMPVQYTSVIDEHVHTRQKAGLFDISHMGEIEITGHQSFQFLQYMLTVDLHRLSPDRCMYSLLCNPGGGTIDDCFLYCFSSHKYWLVVNAANIDKDVIWLRKHAAMFQVSIRNISVETAKIDIQGPLSEKVLSSMMTFPVSIVERFNVVEARVANIPAIISRTGYTGEDGFEIYFSANHAEKLWLAFLEFKDIVKPVGLGARDTLRLEACYSLYGHELSEEISPIEAGLAWAVHGKEADFQGKAALLKQKKQPPVKKLYAFEMLEKAVPRTGYDIFIDTKKAGTVTSGTFAPTLNRMIGLGYIEAPGLKPGDKIAIKIREKLYRASITKRPFYTYQGGKTDVKS